MDGKDIGECATNEMALTTHFHHSDRLSLFDITKDFDGYSSLSLASQTDCSRVRHLRTHIFISLVKG